MCVCVGVWVVWVWVGVFGCVRECVRVCACVGGGGVGDVGGGV